MSVTITDTVDQTTVEPVIIADFRDENDSIAKVNIDGSWTVNWPLVEQLHHSPEGSPIQQLFGKAFASLLLAGRDNFLEVSQAEAEKIAVDIELQKRLKE